MKKINTLGMVSVMLLAGSSLLSPAASFAGDTVTVGVVTTISGPAGYLGADVRDGLQLAIDQAGGKFGGHEVKLVVQDDAADPEKAKSAMDLLIRRDSAKIITGGVFSHVALATAPSAARQGAVFVSPVAGPSLLAGSGCNASIFVASEQNDGTMEAAGEIASKKGYKTAFILAPNYAAGKDALTGFKRTYKGSVVGEKYTDFTQTDFSAEIAEIRDSKPEVVFQFLFGEAASNFINQYVDAGIKTPLILTPYSLDEAGLKNLGAKAQGITVTTYWDKSFDNPANKAFVEKFTTKFGRPPSIYAATGYDTGNLIGAGIAAAGADVADQAKLSAAIASAKFDSVRGSDFALGHNRFPVQDYYATTIVSKDGATKVEVGEKVFSKHVDAYAAECPQ